MTKVGVMHLIDTLEVGGAERVAVNLVNRLPRNRFDVTLCSTRRDGPLSSLVADDVERLSLGRRHRYDGTALRRLVRFIREHNVRILHAHGSSLFIAKLASMAPPYPRVVWHDHYGPNDRPIWVYRAAIRGVDAVLAVNGALADWARRKLRVRPERVWYVPNFVTFPKTPNVLAELPGHPGRRIACVANLRPEKDHMTLLKAMGVLVTQSPSAHLLLLGANNDPRLYASLMNEVEVQGLSNNVTYLGVRSDVPAILKSCDVGVLSSISEGLPLALLEYGMAGLPVVATAVGQCPEILDGGRAGILVPPKSPESLAQALLFLLESPQKRAALGSRLDQHVRNLFDPDAITEQICSIYETVAKAR